MIHADYILDGDSYYYFSSKEWSELVISSVVAASISIFCNLLVISLQFFMLWRHYGAANRLTLRLIVTACIFNMIYCSLEITTVLIDSNADSCRPLIYLIVSFDTISSMSLAMVGVNLVMIFIFKVSRSMKSEIVYYIVVLFSGIVVAVIPLLFGHKKSPTHLQNVTCWYHYYFEDRFENIFNWMWYYSWIMLSVVVAAICAIISIGFVVKNQENLIGVLNMFGQQRGDEVTRAEFINRYGASNKNIFLKIARRCVCYPLVPLFSKIWGVAIAIASARNNSIPFPIFVIDRVFTCLSGLMIACIYFSDPTVKTLIKETINSIKRAYVYDYYCIKYQPGFNHHGFAMDERKYIQELQIVSLDKNAVSPVEYIKIIKSYSIREQENSSLDTSQPNDNLQHPLEISEAHTVIPIVEPPSVEFEVVRGEHIDSFSKDQRERCSSVITLIFADGKIVIPKDHIIAAPKKRHSFFSFGTNNISTVPMKRVSYISASDIVTKNRTSSILEDSYACHTEFVETVVGFHNPRTAKFIHWCLITIFRVKPRKFEDDPDNLENNNHQKKRDFRDFTDSSNPQSPVLDSYSRASASFNKIGTQPSISQESLQVVTNSDENNAPAKIENNLKKDNRPIIYTSPGETSSVAIKFDPQVKRPAHHRSISINVASLNRQKIKADSPPASTKSKPSLSATQKIAASFGLRRLLDKRLTLPSSIGKTSKSSQSNIDIIQSEEEGEEMEEIVDNKIEYQSTESIPTDVPTKSLAAMDEFEFAVELSPRPIRRYQKTFSKPKTLTSCSIKEPKSKSINIANASEDHDASSFGVSTKSNNIPTISIPEKPVRKLSNDSFKDISTSLNYISNWQLDNSRERIGATLEHWNLEQQLQDQMENPKSLN